MLVESSVSLCERRAVSFSIHWCFAVSNLFQVQPTLHLTVDPVNAGVLNGSATASIYTKCE